jgi:hypothetical protein
VIYLKRCDLYQFLVVFNVQRCVGKLTIISFRNWFCLSNWFCIRLVRSVSFNQRGVEKSDILEKVRSLLFFGCFQRSEVR